MDNLNTNGHSTIPETIPADEGPAHNSDAAPPANRYCGRSIFLLAVLAVACVVLVLNSVSFTSILPIMMAFPFAQIGRGLRALSLPGGAGNIIAIVLYVAFCLLPLAALLLIRAKKPVDMLLPVISIVLFVVMYYMVNPGLTQAAAAVGPLEQALLGGAVYSLLMAYGLIRVMLVFNTASTRGLACHMGIILHILGALFVFAAFGITFAQMLTAFEALRAANTMHGQQLGTTYVFLAMQHITVALPYLLNVWVLLAAQRLLAAFNADPYGSEALAAAKNVSQVCVTALAISLLVVAGSNLLQLMFISQLYAVNSHFSFPVTSILFVLGALLLTRYISENKLLKDENEQFV